MTFPRMNERRRPMVVAVFVVVALTLGCQTMLFVPDPSPGRTLAKRLEEPHKVVEWTLRQQDGWDVDLGASALLSFVFVSADSDEEPPPAGVRLEVIDGLGQIAEKLATGWPVGQEQWPALSVRLMYWNAARIASTLDDPTDAFRRIEPADRASERYMRWREAGVEFGVFEDLPFTP